MCGSGYELLVQSTVCRQCGYIRVVILKWIYYRWLYWSGYIRGGYIGVDILQWFCYTCTFIHHHSFIGGSASRQVHYLDV